MIAQKPDFGSPPELLWLPVERLRIDREYQRSIETKASQKLIARIAAAFRWSSFQAILVCPVSAGEQTGPDQQWWIIDGQHRSEGARRAGVDRVPAVVIPEADRAAQAAAFVRSNEERVRMNEFAIHHARIVAGDELAIDVDTVCRNAGVTIPKYQLPLNRLKPGVTLALGAIRSMTNKLGVPASTSVLRCITEAWPSTPAVLRAPIIRALASMVEGTGIQDRAALYTRLKEYFKRFKPDELFNRGYVKRMTTEAAEHVCLIQIIREDWKRDEERAARAAGGWRR